VPARREAAQRKQAAVERGQRAVLHLDPGRRGDVDRAFVEAIRRLDVQLPVVVGPEVGRVLAREVVEGADEHAVVGQHRPTLAPRVPVVKRRS
jgi:hypothetical protein